MFRSEMIKLLEEGKNPIDVTKQKWLDIRARVESGELVTLQERQGTNCALCEVFRSGFYCTECPLALSGELCENSDSIWRRTEIISYTGSSKEKKLKIVDELIEAIEKARPYCKKWKSKGELL